MVPNNHSKTRTNHIQHEPDEVSKALHYEVIPIQNSKAIKRMIKTKITIKWKS